nr:hypothetical protein [Tanacetum cinerariifolium]
MANSNNPYAFPAPHQDQPSFNQNYMQQPMPNPEDITDPTTAMNMALALMAKAFKVNYSTPTNNNQRISSNPRNRESEWVQRGTECQESARAEGNAAGHNGNQIRCYNCRGVGHFARNCTVRPRRREAAYLQTQLLIASKEEAGIQLQAEEFDLIAAAADLDEIEKVNANCILMANLQQASTSSTQSDKAPVYDSDGSTERISSNPRNRQIAQPGMNMGQDRLMQMVGGNGGNHFRQYAGQNAGNLNGYNAVQNVGIQVAQNPRVQNDGNQNQIRNDCTIRPRRRDAAYLQTQLLIAQKEEAGIQLQAEEYDQMAAAADLDEFEEVNANYILMANLQQASSSSTQTDSTHVYDTDGSAENDNDGGTRWGNSRTIFCKF